jgi:glycosyltransferase involved in cell wall biosynthesis
LVELITYGVLPAQEVSGQMRQADMQLFLRGCASSRRSTLVAGIAHGLPIVAFRGVETCWPVTEAGISLVPEGDLAAAARGISHLATDRSHANLLTERNEASYVRFFSWASIAAALLEGGVQR